MSKAERLFHLYSLLRSRRTAMTAEAIADVLEISVRTVYRDVKALSQSGVPIDGESGVGYLLRPGFELAPLMFTPEELLGLMVGVRMVRAFTDPDLARSASQSEQKIRSILTDPLKLSAERQPYRIPILDSDNELREVHRSLRLACEEHRKVRVVYCDEQQQETERVLWPLGIIGWTGRWTLLAWCELREDYRNFRFDRFNAVDCLEEMFTPASNVSITHYFEKILGVPDNN